MAQCVDQLRVSPDEREGYWFSDGYGDYMIHFLDGIAAIPAWAPSSENHLLRSSSVVTAITYAPKEVRYTTFDGTGVEDLRLASAPAKIEGATFTSNELAGGGRWVRVQRAGARSVVITLR